MNIVFMGSPDFAVPSLELIHKSSHSVKAVVSSADKRRGRGTVTTPTPIKAKAIELGLTVIEAEDLKSQEFAHQLQVLEADIFVVVAFRVLPKTILPIPKKGSINLHASLLPKYRGAAPIHWAVMNGDKKTGCTIFFLDEKVDTGQIILQKETNIGDEETTGSVYNRLMHLGSETLLEALDSIENETYSVIKQDDSQATPAPKLFREDCHINFNRPAEEIHNQIRGLSPFPTAWASLKGEKFNIYESKLGSFANIDPGELLIKNEKLFAGCLDGTIEIT